MTNELRIIQSQNNSSWIIHNLPNDIPTVQIKDILHVEQRPSAFTRLITNKNVATKFLSKVY